MTPPLLERATSLGRVLFSQDEDLLSICRHRQTTAQTFSGLTFGRQLNLSIGQAIEGIELIAKVYDEVDLRNQIEFLPLLNQ